MRKIIVDRYPELAARPFSGVANGRAFVVIRSSAGPLDDHRPLRKVVPRDITKPKGGEIVAGGAELPKSNRLATHVMGSVPPSVTLLDTPVYHGMGPRGAVCT